VHLKENGFSQSFRVFCSVPIKNMKPVSENRLNLFPVFVFLLIFVFCDFVFKTSSQTPHYGYKTCFVVLETENCFQNRLPNSLHVLVQRETKTVFVDPIYIVQQMLKNMCI